MICKPYIYSFRFVPCLLFRFVRSNARNFITYICIYISNVLCNALCNMLIHFICILLCSLSIHYIFLCNYSTKLFGGNKTITTFVFKKQTNKTDRQILNI